MNLDRIGKYRVVERIGQGAMGEVFKAHDPFLNRYVALKTIAPALAGDPEFRQRFQREAQSAAQLNHPNIVTIYDFGNDDAGLTYMAMELLEGVDLREAIRRRSLGTLLQRLDLDGADLRRRSPSRTRAASSTATSSPGNVHIQPTGQVKILDFGLARLASSEMTKTGTVMGTPHYMSPEQVRGQKADARSDVFSLGAVFYEVLTHQRPFDGRSVSGGPPGDRRAATRRRSARRAPDTPPAIAADRRARARPRPAPRFADAREMGRALTEAREALAGETLVAAARGRGDDPPGPRRDDRGAAPLPRHRGLDRPRPAPAVGRGGAAASCPAPCAPTPRSPATRPRCSRRRRARPLLIAGGALAVAVGAAAGGWLWHAADGPRRPRPARRRSRASSREALLSGKVELARADLDNRAYKDAAEHAREALAIDPTSAEAKEVLDRAETVDAPARRGGGRRARRAGAWRHGHRLRGPRSRARARPRPPGRARAHGRPQPLLAQAGRGGARPCGRRASGRRGTRAATRSPAYAPARQLVADADSLFGQERFAEAAQKYLESRDAFEDDEARDGRGAGRRGRARGERRPRGGQAASAPRSRRARRRPRRPRRPPPPCPLRRPRPWRRPRRSPPRPPRCRRPLPRTPARWRRPPRSRRRRPATRRTRRFAA